MARGAANAGVRAKGKGRWTVVIKFGGKRNDWIVRGSKEEAKAFEARERLKLEASDPPQHRGHR